MNLSAPLLPTILDLLELKSGNSVLDIGCGTGVLAPQLRHFGLFYTGLDASPQMLAHARHFHGSKDFILGNACHLPQRIKRRQYNAITFMFSLQDMHPLNDILFEAASVLQPNGTIIAVLTHPCFRIPRQNGWGYDKARKLHYRRIDRYLTPFSTRSGTGKTVTFHRPLQAYIEALYTAGFYIDQLRELAPTKALLKDLDHKHKKRPHNFDLPSLYGVTLITRHIGTAPICLSIVVTPYLFVLAPLGFVCDSPEFRITGLQSTSICSLITSL